MQETCIGLWHDIADGIRLYLSADAFQRWFAAIQLAQADESALTFQVPNSIYQFWIESNYLDVVKSAAMSVLGSPREIKFRTAHRDAIIGNPPGALSLISRPKLDDPSNLKRSLRKLLDYDFDVLLLCDGRAPRLPARRNVHEFQHLRLQRP
jgi:chromosomal replication initiation ATPase DnaA